MPKYKVKSTKKPYDKSTSRENSASKDKCAVLEAKEGHSKESALLTKVDPSKVATIVESGTVVNVRPLDVVLYNVNV